MLEDWVQRLCLKESFAEAGRSLETLLGLRLGTRTLEHMSQDGGRVRPGLPGALPIHRPRRRVRCWSSPPTARGCRCGDRRRTDRRPHHRRTKGEKANKKQMACVGAVYTIEPFVRTADDILDEVLRDERAGDRPRPQHKHVWAEMTRQVGGETVNAKEALFARLECRGGGPQLGPRPPGDLPDGRRAGVVGHAAGALLRGGRHPGPVPRPGAALGGGPLLPQGGERRGQAVRGGAAAGPAPGPGRLRHRRAAAAAERGEAQRPRSGRW